jgi:hypothetical protein
MKKETCPYARARKWDYTAGCIGIGMFIGYLLGLLLPNKLL